MPADEVSLPTPALSSSRRSASLTPSSACPHPEHARQGHSAPGCAKRMPTHRTRTPRSGPGMAVAVPVRRPRRTTVSRETSLVTRSQEPVERSGRSDLRLDARRRSTPSLGRLLHGPDLGSALPGAGSARGIRSVVRQAMAPKPPSAPRAAPRQPGRCLSIKRRVDGPCEPTLGTKLSQGSPVAPAWTGLATPTAESTGIRRARSPRRDPATHGPALEAHTRPEEPLEIGLGRNPFT